MYSETCILQPTIFAITCYLCQNFMYQQSFTRLI